MMAMEQCGLVVLVLVVWWCVVCTEGAAIVSATEDELPWWRTATVYQVYPRSFKDSDGDGVGDLRGIIQNAEYFKEIGVDAISLSPIFKSPMVDFGYDISDFREVDPVFGTLDDFKELLTKIKSLGMKLLLNMVPNHSSDQHEWFNKSLHRVDPYTDYYVWSDGKIDPETQQVVPPNNWTAKFNGSAWQWREERQQFYLHLFTPQQTDFNFRNPAVVKEFDDILTHWLDVGVDGFTMESAVFLMEGNYTSDEPQIVGTPGRRWEDFNHTQVMWQQGSFDLMEHWQQLVYNYSLHDGKQRAFFMEGNTENGNILKFYGHGNTTFAIPLNVKLQQDASQSTRAPELRDIIQNYLSSLTPDETPNWVIGNHDNIRMADRYGVDAVDAMGMLQGVLPGVKLVYYGEEIGMSNTFVLWNQTVDPSALVLGPSHYQERDRDPERTPMQWDNTVSAGFSSSNKTWLPVNINYLRLNVEAQRRAAESHLKVFQDVSEARRDQVLQRGKTLVLAHDDTTLTVMRYYSGTFYIYIFNMASENAEFTTQNYFSPLGIDMDMSVEVASSTSNIAKGSLLRKGSASLTLRPRVAVILRSPPSASGANSLLVMPALLILGLMIRLLA